MFYLINSGIINGMPKLVDKIGLPALMLIYLIIFSSMVASIVKKKYLYALGLTSTVLILIG